MSTPTGFDTGFFVLLAEEQPTALDLWDDVIEGRRGGFVSAITCFELERLGLRGAVPRDFVDSLFETLPLICRVLWPESLGDLQRAARLSHGNGLSMADSLILSPLLRSGCREVYTTDGDLLAYEGTGVQVLRLRH